jgi:RHH-type proline utilization regulon transcriptional repressor/proline dehydrogenase/delta 1-pyrroline-5-carboxylate dehydrogenase
MDDLKAAAGSDAWWMAREFGIGHDPSALACESNLFRYRPIARCLIRAGEALSDAEIARLIIAARAAGSNVELSLPPGREFALPGIAVWHESTENLVRRLPDGGYGLLRAPSPGPEITAAAIEGGIRLVSHLPVFSGKIELPAHFREQAVAETLHRHGSVLPRPRELR